MLRFKTIISKLFYDKNSILLKEDVKHIKESGLFNAEFYLEENLDVKGSGINPLLHYLVNGGFEGRKPNPLFDSSFYLESYSDVRNKSINPLLHYILWGKKEGRHINREEYHISLINESELFNSDFYLKNYPDVKSSNIAPSEHYYRFGWKEGRMPSREFDTSLYLRLYPDVFNSNTNPLLHYILSGKKEGRFTNEGQIIKSEILKHRLFDKEYYLSTYPDLSSDEIDPYTHFMTYGWKEARNPSKKFNTSFYLQKYPDIKKSNTNPLVHYVKMGIKEGRISRALDIESTSIRESLLFDEDYYFNVYKDLKPADIDAASHYCEHGWKEGRNPSISFNTKFYLDKSKDVQKSNTNPLLHYINFGKKEGRLPSPDYHHCLTTTDYAEIHENKHEFKGRIAVVIHLFYEDFIPYFIEKIKNIPHRFDIYISTLPHLKTKAKREFSYHFGIKHVTVHVFKNRGRDIAPFLLGFGHTLKDYDLVCKIHSKKSPHKLELSTWRDHLIDNLLGSEEIVNTIIGEFNNNDDLGILYPVITKFLKEKIAEISCWGNNYEIAAPWLDKLELESNPSDEFDFPVGSMFWFRPKAIEPLLDLNLVIDDFDEEAGQVDGTFAHVLERLLGFACQKQSLKVKSCFLKHNNFRVNAISPAIEREASTKTSKNPISFSIVMPTWNRKDVIDRAINSVLKQTYQNYELIISDDGSEDGTKEYLLEKYASEIDSGKIVCIFNEHKGVSATRNSALTVAKNDYIVYLDSDNQWRENYLLMVASHYIDNPDAQSTYSQIRINDGVHNRYTILKQEFNLEKLKERNYIDLNIYSHRKSLYKTNGGFDENLRRLVDWDLIIRYSEIQPPNYIPYVLCDYFLDENLKNITYTVSLDKNLKQIKRKDIPKEVKNLAYILPDFPAKSQTFVFAEMREIIKRGINVTVYYSIEADIKANLDFEVDSYLVKDADQLANLLVEHKIDWAHCHFAYPTVTNFMYPASLKTNIPFTFMPHAVDIFAYTNIERNNINAISSHNNCMGVIVHGNFHENFLIKQGVPMGKILKGAQAIEIPEIHPIPNHFYTEKKNTKLRVISIARFVEKKGLEYLIDAAAHFEDDELEVLIYGYGPLKDKLQKQIDSKKITNVFIKPPFSTVAERNKIFKSAHLFALPCIRAENGDMDGVPTVFFESIAAGVPIISTNVAGIPDYFKDNNTAFLVEQKSAVLLADKLREIHSMPRHILGNMAENAQQNILPKVGTNVTVNAITSFFRHSLDIVMVIAPGVNLQNAYRLIGDIEKRTSTNHKLTIVDNGNPSDVSEKIQEIADKYINVDVTTFDDMVGLGIACNDVFAKCKGEYIIYICANEGCVTKRGWERPILNHMTNTPEAAMGGTLVSSPKWLTASEYEKNDWFKEFRNQKYAQKNPNKPMKHVQGGLFILRKDVIKDEPFYATPHHYMDVELSYYLESLGYQLTDIPEIVALTVLTLPKLTAYLNEDTCAVHPVVTDNEFYLIDQCIQRKDYCNITGTVTSTTSKNMLQGATYKTGTTQFSRTVYQFLGKSEYVYRGFRAVAYMPEESLKAEFKHFFQLEDFLSDESEVVLHNNCDIFIHSKLNKNSIFEFETNKLDFTLMVLQFEDESLKSDFENITALKGIRLSCGLNNIWVYSQKEHI